MTNHYRKVALACVMILAAAASAAGTAQAQSAGPWISTYIAPDGSRCFVGTWSGGYNGNLSMRGQFCYRGGYPSAFGPGPWTGGYPSNFGAVGPYASPFYPGYGPQPFPYYPWPSPWGF
ncbi:MAG: hypothetical protein ACLP7P_08925 [Rhodomicrobium sp.]